MNVNALFGRHNDVAHCEDKNKSAHPHAITLLSNFFSMTTAELPDPLAS